MEKWAIHLKSNPTRVHMIDSMIATIDPSEYEMIYVVDYDQFTTMNSSVIPQSILIPSSGKHIINLTSIN